MFKIFKRDFMLGIGVGLIISGILVSLSGNGHLTDEEIIDRAVKLGMVQKQEVNMGQSEIEQEKSESPQETKPQETKPQETKPQKTPQQKPEQANSAPVQQSVDEKVEVVTIEVKPGMGSESVIKDLEKKGVISDKEELYKVMTKYNAHSRLRVGTFKVPAGAGMKEIVDILTGKAGK